MKTLLAALTVTALSFAAPARAGETSGLSVGLRAAYGIPLGTAGDGAHLNDLASGAVPLQLDLGWRIDRHWYAGGYFVWGPTFVAGQTKEALQAAGVTDVSGHYEQRAGVQGTYTFDAVKGFSPWAGVGAGYEWTRYAQGKIGGTETEVGVRGFEAALQLGADYRVTPKFAAGPFVTVNVGQYSSSMKWVDNGDETSKSISDKGIHEWLQLGVRGSFDL